MNSEIHLSYSLQPTDNSFVLNDSAAIEYDNHFKIITYITLLVYKLYNKMHIITRYFSFGTDPIVLQCRYARTVTATSDVSIEAPETGPTVGNGDLTYTMEVNPGILGGTTDVTISSSHSISGISPR